MLIIVLYIYLFWFQSDAEGKITDEAKFTEIVSEMYGDDEVKAKAKEVSPKCVEQGNAKHGTGRFIIVQDPS